MITRKYKLAANFNTVELEFDDEEILSVATDNELDFDGENAVVLVSDEVLVTRLLQREYDIIAGVKVVPASSSSVEPVEKPSAKQIEWAKNLGMKNPENCSKREVWEYIQRNK